DVRWVSRGDDDIGSAPWTIVRNRYRISHGCPGDYRVWRSAHVNAQIGIAKDWVRIEQVQHPAIGNNTRVKERIIEDVERPWAVRIGPIKHGEIRAGGTNRRRHREWRRHHSVATWTVSTGNQLGRVRQNARRRIVKRKGQVVHREAAAGFRHEVALLA